MLQQKRYLLVLFVMCLSVFFLCSDEDPESAVDFDPPSNLEAVNNTNSVELSWTASSYETEDDFEGYIIYAALSSISALETKSELDSFAVDIATNSTSKEITLDQDQVYYVSVRGLKDNGKISLSSNEIMVSPRPEGTGTIYEFASASGNPSAFDFSVGDEVSLADYDDVNQVDIYLDGDNQSVLLKSPDKLDNSKWDNRITKLKNIGSSDFDDYFETTDSGWDSDGILAVDDGDVIALKTSEGNFIKLKITSSSGTSPDRTITFQWAYQDNEDQPLFK